MPEQADVIVIGLGTSGEELAGRLAMRGVDVVGIEPKLVGGECAYWACIPTKMMIRAANLLAEARRVDGFAGRVEVTPDWAPVARRIREHATGDWDDSLAVRRFQDRGGRFVRGHGRLTALGEVTVGDQVFRARRAIVIATGSRPVIPSVPGLEDVNYWTSHEAVAADELPESLIVLGGGVVGCELGQVFARFGVKVSIVDGGDRLLGAEEPEAGDLLRRVFEAEGVEIHAGVRAERITPRRGGVVLTGDGSELSAEQLLVAVGRRANVDDLGLEIAGISPSARHLEVDGRMRAAPGIWGMGDVTGEANFTHRALYQAPIVEADILDEDPPPAEYRAMPRVTFTDPEIAAVGMTEVQARDSDVNVGVITKQVPATFKGWIYGTGNEGFIKLIVDRERDVLIGATCAGPRASEVIGLLTAAVQQSIPLGDLRRMMYAFPTFYGGIGEAIGAYGRALVQVLDPEAESVA
jgi:pyruvate/2-oxoglutarate dehydrogenase complex dihydrolipoamide dehydrogenase (E3) component